jgi:hypothetical protein
MARITYIEPSGQPVSVNVTDGWSLMQGATAERRRRHRRRVRRLLRLRHLPLLRRPRARARTAAAVGGRAGDAGQRGRRTPAEQPPVVPDQGLAGAGGPDRHAARIAGMNEAAGVLIIGRRPGRRAGGRSPAHGRLHRPHHDAGRRADRPVPPAAAVQGLAGRRGRRSAAGDAIGRGAGAQDHHAAHRRARGVDRPRRAGRAPRQRRSPALPRPGAGHWIAPAGVEPAGRRRAQRAACCAPVPTPTPSAPNCRPVLRRACRWWWWAAVSSGWKWRPPPARRAWRSPWWKWRRACWAGCWRRCCRTGMPSCTVAMA